MTTDIIERMKLIEVAEQEVARRQCELDAKIRRPAEAEKYRCEAMAVANKQKTTLEASGVAEGLMMKGESDSFSLEVTGKADAEVMAMKADAWKEYQKAAKLSLWLEALPKVAAEVAAPMSQVNGITMVGFPDSDQSLGPARLTGEVLEIMEKMPDAVSQFTGHKARVA